MVDPRFHVCRFVVRSLNSSGRQCRDWCAIVGVILPVSFKVSREKRKERKKRWSSGIKLWIVVV